MRVIRTGEAEMRHAISYTQQNLDSKKSSLAGIKPSDPSHDATIFISDEAQDLFTKEKELHFNKNEFTESELAQMLEQLRESSDPSNNPYMDKIKCLQIALRIINGDRVPIKDRKFLMEKEPEMYSQAILLSRKNDKPKKYKSLLDDEKSDTKINQAAPASAEATAQSPAESEAGEASSDGEGEGSAE